MPGGEQGQAVVDEELLRHERPRLLVPGRHQLRQQVIRPLFGGEGPAPRDELVDVGRHELLGPALFEEPAGGRGPVRRSPPRRSRQGRRIGR